MKNLNLKTIINLVSFGHPDSRLAYAHKVLALLLSHLRWLSHSLTRQRADFRRTLEAWEARYITEELAPYAVQHDVDQGRKIRLYAWIAVLAELGMSFFMALSFGVPVLFALGLAVVATYVTKAMLMALWSNRLQPQETICRLRRFIIAPFGLLTFASLAVLLLASRGTGGLLLLLAGLLNISLFGVSFGLLFLAAGLLCYADVLLWSQRAERKYQQTYQELSNTNEVYELVQRVIRELTPPVVAPAPLAAATHQPNFVAQTSGPIRQAKPLMRVVAPLLLTAAIFNSACDGASSKLTLPTAESVSAATPTAAETEMQVFVDGSFSNQPQMLADAVQQLLRELPGIVERHRVNHFAAYLFGQDGWAATKTVALDLPKLETVRHSEAGDILPQLQAAEKTRLLEAHREALREHLQRLTPVQLLPDQNAVEPPCTDLNGVFARLAGQHQSARRLVVIITDGHESCAAALRPVKLPSQTTVVIVLLGEDARNLNGQPQYILIDARRQQLQQAVPQATILTPDDRISEALPAPAAQ